MASGPAAQPVLSERADVHKSCKSFETLVNILNDYCEAASSIVALQKKLAKASRETAGLKVTGEIAANALNASAAIFEALSDIDTKFGKIADKECDTISAEVKKWFNKLAKEERAHDERINSANIRIKQAGQAYEKKAKKKARDASDEHAQYINLISTLAPEISREKYNHALLVTQKHTSTTYSVAACLSRIADIEWVRSCEEVRRFAPIIGQLGEWRTLCEGGWTGSIPQDLPGSDNAQQRSPSSSHEDQATSQWPPIPTMEKQDNRDPQRLAEQDTYNYEDRTTSNRNVKTLSGEPFLSRKPSYHFFVGKQAQTSSSSDQNGQNAPLDPPKAPFVGNEKWTDSVGSAGSVTSLSSFPSPPTYVPVPPTSAESDAQPLQSRPLPAQSQPASTSPRLPPLSESPKSLGVELSPTVTPAVTEGPKSSRTRDDQTTPPMMSVAPDGQEKGRIGPGLGESTEPNMLVFGKNTPDGPPGNEQGNSPTPRSQMQRQSLHIPDAPQGIEKSISLGSPSSAASTGSAAHKQQGDYLTDELGADRNGGYGQLKSRSVNSVNSQELERKVSSGSTGSIVATMRSRYANAAGSSLPTPRDVPRLPLSVNDLASRYHVDGPPSSRRRVPSPIDERQPRSLEVVSPRPTPYSQDRSPDGKYTRFPSPSTEANMEELARRRRQRQELAEQEQKQKEQALRDRQQEIEMRTRELERDRALFLCSRDGDAYSDVGHTVRTTQSNDAPEPYSQFDPPTPVISRGRYSYSTTHLVPPSSPSTQRQHSRSQPPSPADDGQTSTVDHAKFCGCATCSASKYKTRNTPSPYDLRPPEPPITLRPEKPKGWIRRLSMPVGNAFSLDSKKSNPALKASLAAGEDGRIRRSFEQGGISNLSISNIGRR